MNRLRNGQGPRQTPPPEAQPGSHSLDVYGYFQDAIAKLRAGFCFSAAPKMAPGERHTPCHDVIQGTCRPRRSGPLPASRSVRRMTPQHFPTTISPGP
ncbi:hypothetical protein SNOG_13397 [Parastagonospora nodorum SN15]|uniref:Uncharacterized protein n=1 Tax=Phaeosphaeria nodorum (strain SN15 / ATCC MYA-4574 / FGSC 10173) TaxID=321614 RepID=Q0U4B7_PHANO|nr:hypothetical protein SNOG_13397 [Parastagonospora nodorum SN15]EAT79281.1 hypothetical protein SNOG_13397 [Parastagonospora nodorum SN15]